MEQVSGGQWQLAAQNKRKEKARIAARARRSQEANIIMDIASELHITQEKLRRIDKATIVKLAIDYLKAFDVLCRTNQAASSTAPSSQAATRQTSAAQQMAPNTKCHQHHHQQQQQQPLPNDISNIENDKIIIRTQYHNRHNNKHNHEDNHDDHLAERHGAGKQRSLLTPSSLELPNKIIKIDEEQQQMHQLHQLQQQQQQQQQISIPFSAPILTTSLIFAPKTIENANEHYLMIEEKSNGNPSFVLKPDSEISDEDDLTHLAPQAGDISISLDVTYHHCRPFLVL